jgi:hypothetical protein
VRISRSEETRTGGNPQALAVKEISGAAYLRLGPVRTIAGAQPESSGNDVVATSDAPNNPP